MARPTLTDVSGVGPATAEALKKAGIRGVASLAKASVEVVRALPGFGPARAAAVMRAAQALLATESATPVKKKPAPAQPAAAAPQKDKKDKKDKKGKKGKDKGKKKSKKKGKKGKGKDKKGKGKDKKKGAKGKGKSKSGKGKRKKKSKK